LTSLPSPMLSPTFSNLSQEFSFKAPGLIHPASSVAPVWFDTFTSSFLPHGVPSSIVSSPLPPPPSLIPSSPTLLDQDTKPHLSVQRNVGGKFQCPYCGKSYNFKHSLRDHMNKHMGKKPHVCKHCGDSFTHLASLCAHIKRRHDSKMPQDFQCAICSEKFMNQQSLKQHFTWRHKGCDRELAQSLHPAIKSPTSDKPIKDDNVPTSTSSLVRSSPVYNENEEHTQFYVNDTSELANSSTRMKEEPVPPTSVQEQALPVLDRAESPESPNAVLYIKEYF
jgi:transcription elongation factor Elf1